MYAFSFSFLVKTDECTYNVQGHRFDPDTPVAETVRMLSLFAPKTIVLFHSVFFFDQMQALHDVVKAGYVRYIGMSSCYAYQCETAAVSKFRFADISPG